MLELFECTYEGNHYLGIHFDAACLAIECGLNDCAGLHLGDFRICDAETAATVSEHGVELFEAVYFGFYFLECDTHFLSKLFLRSGLVRHEFMQWRVKQTYCYAEAIHCLEDSFEVSTLHGEQFCQSYLAAFYVVCENHFANGLDAVAFEEHVLCAAEADSLCSEVACLLSITRCVGVSAYQSLGVFVGEIHDSAEVTTEFRFCCRHLTVVNVSCATVEGNPVAFVVNLTAHFHGLGLVVDFDFAGTGDAAFAHTASHHSCVACHAAAHCEDALSHCHAAKVFGRSLNTYEHYFLFLFSPSLGVVSLEHYLTCCGTRRSGKTLGNNFGAFEGCLVEYWVKQLVKFVRLHAQQGGLLVNFAGAEEFHGYAYHGHACAFAVTGLEHPELAVLDSELHVLHILIIVFETMCNGYQLSSTVRHCLFERRIVLATFFFGDALKLSPTARSFHGDLLGSAYAGNYILALSVDEVFAVENILAGSGVTAEGNAGSGVVAHVAVNHSLYVYCGTPLFGNLVHATIKDSTFVHPGVENGANAAPELFPGTFGEVLSGIVFYGDLEAFHQFLEVIDVKFIVELDTFFLLNLVHDSLKGVNVGF